MTCCDYEFTGISLNPFLLLATFWLESGGWRNILLTRPTIFATEFIMSYSTTPKSHKHLINILKISKDSKDSKDSEDSEDAKEHYPCFTVLLGAGASINSGVKTASQMVATWQKDYDDIHGEGSVQKKQYKRSEEYASLFEALYDQPSQRREYIESCLKGASPSWGYIFLMNLLRKKVFNTVFTTNFDDLLNESCYNFSSDVRPIVCAHDSSVKNIRITTTRPKIIKLHGDFLFDNIKNTSRELETLEVNMREKFRQFAPEFGMIVIGYAGNDRSVMETISSLLSTEGNFPHGVYWCHLKGEEKNFSDYVEGLRRHQNFHTVAIKGFDEFMAEIHDSMELKLPDEISDPYNALKEKLNGLLKYTKTPEEDLHPVIADTIKALSRNISRYDDNLPETRELTRKISLQQVPFQFIADFALRQGNYDEAIGIIKQYLHVQPNSQAIQLSIRYLDKKWDDELADTVEKIILSSPKDYIDQINSLIVAQIKHHKFDASRKICQSFEFVIEGTKIFGNESVQYFLINYAQVFMHMKETLPDKLCGLLQVVYNTTKHSLAKMGAAIILGNIACNTEEKEEYFNETIRILNEDGESEGAMASWPIFWLLPEKFKDNARLFQSKN